MGKDIKLMVPSSGACQCLASMVPLEVRNQRLPEHCYRKADESLVLKQKKNARVLCQHHGLGFLFPNWYLHLLISKSGFHFMG